MITKLHTFKSDQDQVDHYTEKFAMKMTGSLPTTAAWWIEGTDQPDELCLQIWSNVGELIDWESRDRAAENDDWPHWIPEECRI